MRLALAQGHRISRKILSEMESLFIQRCEKTESTYPSIEQYNTLKSSKLTLEYIRELGKEKWTEYDISSEST